MKVSLIGVGNVGKALARRLASANHEVVLGVRRESFAKHEAFAKSIGAKVCTPQEAVRDSQVLLLATPWQQTQAIIQSLGDFAGKILIDATNPIAADFSGLEVGHTTSGAELVASWAKGARVVKCFNQTGYEGMENPQFGAQKAVQFVAGDDAEACATVMTLCSDVGFEAVMAGNLSLARQLEQFAWLWIHMAIKRKMGRGWAFAISRRL